MTKFTKTLLSTLVAMSCQAALATEYPYTQPATTLTNGADAAASVGNISPIQQTTANPTATGTGTGTATANPILTANPTATGTGTATANPVNTLNGGNVTVTPTNTANPTATSSALGGSANLNGTVSGTNQLSGTVSGNVNGTNTGTFTNDGRQTTTVGTSSTSGANANVGNVTGGTATIQDGAVRNTVGVQSTNTNSVAGGSVKDSGNSASTSAASSNGGTQGQTQSQSTQSGASSTSGASTANNGGGNGNSVVNIDQRQVRQTPVAYAPAIYQTTPCAGAATSGGASTGVFAFSIGHASIDQECQINAAELTLRQMSALYGEEAAADIAMRIRCKSELLGVNADECNFYREAAKLAVVKRQASRDAVADREVRIMALEAQLAAKQAVVAAPAPVAVAKKAVLPKAKKAQCPSLTPCSK